MTPDIDALRALLARVDGDKRADRKFDSSLWFTLKIGTPEEQEAVSDAYIAAGFSDDCVKRSPVFIPDYTASLDAAVALVDRVLPTWWWAISRTPARGWHEGEVYPPNYDSGDPLCGVGGASTPALALCIALLKALVAQAEAPAAR